MVTVHDQKRI